MFPDWTKFFRTRFGKFQALVFKTELVIDGTKRAFKTFFHELVFWLFVPAFIFSC
jgi:hypothetical protein